MFNIRRTIGILGIAGLFLLLTSGTGFAVVINYTYSILIDDLTETLVGNVTATPNVCANVGTCVVTNNPEQVNVRLTFNATTGYVAENTINQVALTEGVGGPNSDIVAVLSGAIDAITGSQAVEVKFFSDTDPTVSLPFIDCLPVGTICHSSSINETGTLQDLSATLDPSNHIRIGVKSN